MATPVGAVQGQNAHKGVKRSVLGNPVGVPTQLPGFRGRAVGPAAPVKVPTRCLSRVTIFGALVGRCVVSGPDSQRGTIDALDR